jgi:hypothetical protein
LPLDAATASWQFGSLVFEDKKVPNPPDYNAKAIPYNLIFVAPGSFSPEPSATCRDRQRHTKYHEEMLKCSKVAMALRRPRQSNRIKRRN